MAAKCLFFLLIVTSLVARSSLSREFPHFLSVIPSLTTTDLHQVPEAKDQSLDCFSALFKIKSCSNEIVAYFAKGDIDITHPCCEAITLITHHCWPTVLITLGYGADQIGILRGYCDAVAPDGRAYGPVPSPGPSPLGPSPSPFGQPLPVVTS